ncbi:MAG: (d)CMP kinase [Marmoricola sp.]
MSSTVVVAMDGPSGAGKSSTARGVAVRLGLRYLDTGAQYRAIAVWMLRHGVDLTDPGAVAARVGEPELVSGTDPAHPGITLDGEDVSGPIRSAETTAAVSAVAAVPEVRHRLVQMQRSEIGDGGIVVEGRDIASVVAPDAAVKVYLTADTGARAVRRTVEQGGDDSGVTATEADLLRRDRADSRTTPLELPDGAVHIDTTHATLDQVIERVVSLVERAVVTP